MPKIQHRRTDLDIAKAMAIILVVFHHTLQYLSEHASQLLKPAMLQPVLLAMNGVHITTFMFVGGMASAIARRRNGTSLSLDPSGMTKRIRRLGIPLLFIAAITFILKIVTGSGLGPELSAEAVHTILTPRLGIASHLWFIHALLLISLIFPILFQITPKSMLWILPVALIAIAAAPIPIPTRGGHTPWFGINDVLWFLPFYAIGYVLVSRRVNLRREHRVALLGICVSAYALTLTAMLIPDVASLLHNLEMHRSVRWVNGLCGATGLILLSTILMRSEIMHRFGTKLGTRCYEVYLLHAMLAQFLAVLIASKITGSLSVTMSVVLIVPASIIGSLMIGKLARRTRLGAFLLLGKPLSEKRSSVRIWKNGSRLSTQTQRHKAAPQASRV